MCAQLGGGGDMRLPSLGRRSRRSTFARAYNVKLALPSRPAKLRGCLKCASDFLSGARPICNSGHCASDARARACACVCVCLCMRPSVGCTPRVVARVWPHDDYGQVDKRHARARAARCLISSRLAGARAGDRPSGETSRLSGASERSTSVPRYRAPHFGADESVKAAQHQVARVRRRRHYWLSTSAEVKAAHERRRARRPRRSPFRSFARTRRRRQQRCLCALRRRHWPQTSARILSVEASEMGECCRWTCVGPHVDYENAQLAVICSRAPAIENMSHTRKLSAATAIFIAHR